MSANTTIEWCDHTWSPWRGCTKVSPGCANCYAETLSKRNPAVLGQWGKGKPRVLAKNWKNPVKWNAGGSICGECGEATHGDRCFRGQCRGKTHRPKVFPSLCDWLDDEVDSVWLYDFIKLIVQTPNLRWLLLTKRPENFVSRLRAAQASCTVDPLDIVDRIDAWISGERIPLNVWVGTSVEDQTRADERIPALLQIPAVGRFLSVEPLLGDVDVERRHRPHSQDGRPMWPTSEPMLFGIDWVIIGGESGPGARPCNVNWIRSLVRQCKDASVPVFVKQMGSLPYVMRQGADGMPLDEHYVALAHAKGGDPAEWPEDLCVRQFPEGLR